MQNGESLEHSDINIFIKIFPSGPGIYAEEKVERFQESEMIDVSMEAVASRHNRADAQRSL